MCIRDSPREQDACDLVSHILCLRRHTSQAVSGLVEDLLTSCVDASPIFGTLYLQAMTKKIIVAIDLGTSNSAYAFSIRGLAEEDIVVK